MTAYAYDNLDVDLKHTTPTSEHTKDTLVYLTTASMFPLNHGIRKSDLEYSDFMWKHLLENKPPVEMCELLTSLPQDRCNAKGFSQHDYFNAWKFCYDLIYFGPSYFATFKSQLGDPAEVECIPLMKMTQIPMRALEISPSTPANNARVLEELFKQSATGELVSEGKYRHTADTSEALPEAIPQQPKTKITDISNHVVLIFGDFFTGQHIQSLLKSCLTDETPLLYHQYVVYSPGLFHLKMGCTHTVYRWHIEAPGAKDNPTSFISYIAQIQPIERHKIETNPSFCQLHEVITHVGIVMQLDAWREATEHHYNIISLENWAKKEPTWENICNISELLV